MIQPGTAPRPAGAKHSPLVRGFVQPGRFPRREDDGQVLEGSREPRTGTWNAQSSRSKTTISASASWSRSPRRRQGLQKVYYTVVEAGVSFPCTIGSAGSPKMSLQKLFREHVRNPLPVRADRGRTRCSASAARRSFCRASMRLTARALPNDCRRQRGHHLDS